MEIVKAKKRKKILTAHGHKRTDYYYWLKDRNNPEVIEYLKRENRYTAKVFNEPTKKLQKRLYNEIVKRIPQRDTTVPFLSNGYLYYVRYDEGKDYPVICRKKNGDNVEEVLLDGNKMAEGHAYFAFGDWDISTNNNLIAYTVDTRSRRKYTLYIKNIISGEVYQDIIKNTSSLRDYIDGENFIKAYLLAYLNLNNFYEVKSEVESNKGYVDIYLNPIKEEVPYGVIIELKYIKRKEFNKKVLEQSVTQAKKQLRQYDLGNRYIKVILVFSGWEMVFCAEVV